MYIQLPPPPPPPPLPHLALLVPFLVDNGTTGGGGGGSDPPPSKELPAGWSSLIGIITAIVGNMLIALALNVQRYAHIRLHQQRVHVRERSKQALKCAANGQNGNGYGTVAAGGRRGGVQNGGGRGGRAQEQQREEEDGVEESGDEQEIVDGEAEDAAPHESDPLTASFRSGDSRWTECSSDDDGDGDGSGGSKVTSTYLKSPYWWLGQVLITVGEMGNFLAYGFAPASIVSPLGVVALISNCVIAPILFKEKFRPRDFWGVVIAIAGAVTVVLSAKQNETKLAPHDVWDAITTVGFEIYLGVTCSLIGLLMWASPRYGNRTILIDLGLVGLFGTSPPCRA